MEKKSHNSLKVELELNLSNKSLVFIDYFLTTICLCAFCCSIICLLLPTVLLQMLVGIHFVARGEAKYPKRITFELWGLNQTHIRSHL